MATSTVIRGFKYLINEVNVNLYVLSRRKTLPCGKIWTTRAMIEIPFRKKRDFFLLLTLYFKEQEDYDYLREPSRSPLYLFLFAKEKGCRFDRGYFGRLRLNRKKNTVSVFKHTTKPSRFLKP